MLSGPRHGLLGLDKQPHDQSFVVFARHPEH